jgi:hypothetical protein
LPLADQFDMSKKINVNPGQYKVAGREHQGDDINPQEEKAAMAKQTEGGMKGSHKPTKPQGA